MPVVTAAVLAVGAREMVREKAIVRRLSALEELSGMEVLCSDKTGTVSGGWELLLYLLLMQLPACCRRACCC